MSPQRSTTKESFSNQDLQRLLEAVFPNLPSNPFSEIEGTLDLLRTLTLDAREWQEEATHTLDHIQTRTFGILFLQVIKTIKFIVGLLPAGRAILIVIAIVTLLTSYLEGETITTEKVRDVIKSSGLARLVEDILRQLEEITARATDDLETFGATVSQLLAGLASDLQTYVDQAEAIADELANADADNWLQATLIGEQRLRELVRQFVESANLSANLQLVATAIVGEIKAHIQQLPNIAKELA